MKYSRRKKRVLLGFFALILVVAFFLLASYRFADAMREQRRYEQERMEMKPPAVNLVQVERRDAPQLRRYAAQLRPWMEAGVPAEVAGRVVEVLVEGGDEVEAGQPLIRLDETLSRIAVDQARSRYEEAVRLQAEAQRLLRTRAISETAFQSQVATVRTDQAALADATERLARHTVRAPFTGVVNERLVDLGDAVNLNEPVVRLVDLEKLRVEFYVSENDLFAFPVGKPVSLQLQSQPGRAFTPEVDFVARSADPATRLFRVEAVLPNPGQDLAGGLQGVVEAEIRRFPETPFVPAAAVRFSGRRSLVWKKDASGEAVLTDIAVGPEIEGYYPVLEGLAEGDEVFIK